MQRITQVAEVRKEIYLGKIGTERSNVASPLAWSLEGWGLRYLLFTNRTRGSNAVQVLPVTRESSQILVNSALITKHHFISLFIQTWDNIYFSTIFIYLVYLEKSFQVNICRSTQLLNSHVLFWSMNVPYFLSLHRPYCLYARLFSVFTIKTMLQLPLLCIYFHAHRCISLG